MNRSIIAVSLLGLACVGCDVSDLVTRAFFRNLPAYFSEEAGVVEKFEKIDEALYSYRLQFDRNLVLRTRAGLVVIDSFNEEFARGLKRQLAREFPGEKIHTLILSHYHLDHVGGAGLLEAERVLTHEKTAAYWRDLQYEPGVAITGELKGDTTLAVGGETLRLLYLGRSHTDTLYAFYFPERRALFAPDMGFVKTVIPGGLPDMYFPGYLAALRRLQTLEFDVFVPSHFDPGTRKDFDDFTEFMAESRRLTDAAMRRYGPIDTEEIADRYYEEVYLPLKEKYGHWHGFRQMILPHLIRNFTGAYLGY